LTLSRAASLIEGLLDFHATPFAREGTMKRSFVKRALNRRNWLVRLHAPALNVGLAYLIALFLLTLAAAPFAKAQSYSIVYSFQCAPSDGTFPIGDLVADSAGNLYGATVDGGEFGKGTLYEISADGTEKVLYSFAGYPVDGEFPTGGLVLDAAGNLYGTTTNGGTYGCGTVFKVTP
jgi:uncharacterized repeat protein (TIGR03803 family)